MSVVLRPMDTAHVVVRIGDITQPERLGYVSFKSRVLSVEPGGYRVETSAGPATFVPFEDTAPDVPAARARLARMMVDDRRAMLKRRDVLAAFLAEGVAS